MQDSAGAPQGEYSTVFTVPAEKVSESTREYADALKRNVDLVALFRVRYDSRIDVAYAETKFQVLFSLNPDASPPNVRTYDIASPYDPTGNRRELLIPAKEIQ